MCGIVGGLSLGTAPPPSIDLMRRMVASLRHRGPDEAGIYVDGPIALGHARLSIIDLSGGLQPLANEDETVWVAANGEVFNYIELGESLRAAGHRFRTGSDCEVLVHLFEDRGPRLLHSLNGQYAFALWDARSRTLMLARDRLGVRPLFYTVVDGVLLFASEIKALLADPHVPRRLDLRSLDQVFTFWSALPGRTLFDHIFEVPAGHYLVARAGGGDIALTRYWTFPSPPVEPSTEDAETVAARLRALLVDATRLRLRADVPVGAYLSGGLDSSSIAAMVSSYGGSAMETFSVAFTDPAFDERKHQERMARHLGTRHHVVDCSQRDIAEAFPSVIWHTETPILRTAPTPLFILSALVRRHGLKVVLTGEGADEVLAGYDTFKEARIRRFWSRQPDSRLRPLLLRRLYNWMPTLHAGSPAFLEAFFRQGLDEVGDPRFSHLLRWRSTARIKRFFSAEVAAELAGNDSLAELQPLLPPRLSEWPALAQAQFLEATTFLTPYLLSSQGDRMAMAHAVEGRFPFLDYRVVEFCMAIPARLRLSGLNEKYILKRAMRDLLPPEICQRSKQPYRAPISAVFCGPGAPEYAGTMLAPESVASAGFFDAEAVSRLVGKCSTGRPASEFDHMALVGILSTQLWHEMFIRDYRRAEADPDALILQKHGPI